MTLDEIYREIIRICRKHHAVRVVLYGSRAKGTNRLESDIDIAVSGVADIDAYIAKLEEFRDRVAIVRNES